MQFIIFLLALIVASGYLDVAVGSNVGKRDAANADMVMTQENAAGNSTPKPSVVAKHSRGNGKDAEGNGKNTDGKTQNAAVAGAGAGATALNPKAIQSGSATDVSVGAAAGQAKSLTDAANFINFCVEKSSQKGVLTNGLQVKAGSCNGIRESFQEHFHHLI